MAIPRLKPFHRGLIAAITTVSLLAFGLSLMIPLLSLEMDRRGASGMLIGLQTAVVAVASLISSLLVPQLIRRFDVRAIISASIALTSFTFPLYPLIESVTLWLPLRAINGFCFATMFVTSEFWITAIAPPARRGFIMGLYATCFSIGLAMGPALIAFVGTRGVFPFLVGSVILLTGLLPLMMPSPALPQIRKEGTSPALLTVLRTAPLAFFAALSFAACESSNFSFLAIWGVRNGMSEPQGALMLTMIGLGNILLQIPIGLMADKINKRLLLFICSAFGAISFASLNFIAHSPLAVYAVLVPFGGIAAGLYTVGLALLGDKFSGTALASANAGLITAYTLGMLVFPPLAGRAMDVWNPNGFIAVSAAVLAIYAAFAAIAPRRFA